MDDGARGVEKLRLVEQAQARGDDANLLVAQRIDQPLQRAGNDDGVGIEEDQGLAARDLGAEIAAAAEAIRGSWEA